jgi:hypothetical protein
VDATVLVAFSGEAKNLFWIKTAQGFEDRRIDDGAFLEVRDPRLGRRAIDETEDPCVLHLRPGAWAI